MKAITPWASLVRVIAPHYPRNHGAGRPVVGLERMLRMYVAQQCFGLSDEAAEDAIYDSQAIRRFVGIDLNREAAPDATPIAAPSSTKNKAGKRDPEMHQSQKGNQWHFVRIAHSAARNHRPCRCPASPTASGGMKAHIGVDANSGLVHTLIGTAGNVHDITQAQALLHGDETDAYGDAGYQGVEMREENLELPVTWHIAMRPSKRKALDKSVVGELMERLEHTKASIRAKVEHPFHVVKNLFQHRKARYKGLAKNTAQLFTLFGFANLVLARRWLLGVDRQVAS